MSFGDANLGGGTVNNKRFGDAIAGGRTRAGGIS